MPTDADFIRFAEVKMAKELITYAKGKIDETKSIEMAKVVVSEIDWSNSALMHKGFSWMAKSFLEKAGILKIA